MSDEPKIKGGSHSDDFEGHPSTDVVTEPGQYDGLPFHAAVSIGPYSVLILSR